jgi:hypothetical protein
VAVQHERPAVAPTGQRAGDAERVLTLDLPRALGVGLDRDEVDLVDVDVETALRTQLGHPFLSRRFTARPALDAHQALDRLDEWLDLDGVEDAGLGGSESGVGHRVVCG